MVGVRFPSKEDHPWPTGTRPRSSATGRTRSDTTAQSHRSCAPRCARTCARCAKRSTGKDRPDGRERAAQTAIKELSKAAPARASCTATPPPVASLASASASPRSSAPPADPPQPPSRRHQKSSRIRSCTSRTIERTMRSIARASRSRPAGCRSARRGWRSRACPAGTATSSAPPSAGSRVVLDRLHPRVPSTGRRRRSAGVRTTSSVSSASYSSASSSASNATGRVLNSRMVPLITPSLSVG